MAAASIDAHDKAFGFGYQCTPRLAHKTDVLFDGQCLDPGEDRFHKVVHRRRIAVRIARRKTTADVDTIDHDTGLDDQLV